MSFFLTCLPEQLACQGQKYVFFRFSRQKYKGTRGSNPGFAEYWSKQAKNPNYMKDPFLAIFWTDFGEVEKSKKGVFFVQKWGKIDFGRFGSVLAPKDLEK